VSRMKLYAHPFSNNSMRAQLSLDEKGLDYEYVKVDLFKGQHKQPDFLAINPRGQVPALVDGDVRIYESVAIVQYLEYRYPDPPLIRSAARGARTSATASTRCWRSAASGKATSVPDPISPEKRIRWPTSSCCRSSARS
jgi:glutathione S-transferase